MTNSVVPIGLVYEDPLCETLLYKILSETRTSLQPYNCAGGGGYQYIKKHINGFNTAAQGCPYLVLVDLEATCPSAQIQEWLCSPRHPNLLLRIAVRESEAWVMADYHGFTRFLGIRESTIPSNVDTIPDPKAFLIELARRSRNRRLREDLVPRANSTAKVGPDYNGRLSQFINTTWDIGKARQHSRSLDRAVIAIQQFKPIFQHGYP